MWSCRGLLITFGQFNLPVHMVFDNMVFTDRWNCKMCNGTGESWNNVMYKKGNPKIKVLLSGVNSDYSFLKVRIVVTSICYSRRDVQIHLSTVVQSIIEECVSRMRCDQGPVLRHWTWKRGVWQGQSSSWRNLMYYNTISIIQQTFNYPEFPILPNNFPFNFRNQRPGKGDFILNIYGWNIGNKNSINLSNIPWMVAV